jgi:hypothetical protein
MQCTDPTAANRTPGRMLKLAQDGHLNLGATSLLLLDGEKDAKGQGVLNMNGVADDLFELLRTHARQHLASAGGAGLRIALY